MFLYMIWKDDGGQTFFWRWKWRGTDFFHQIWYPKVYFSWCFLTLTFVSEMPRYCLFIMMLCHISIFHGMKGVKCIFWVNEDEGARTFLTAKMTLFFKEKDDGVRRHAAGSVPVPPGQGNSFAISPGQHIVTVSFSLILWFLFICVFRKKEYHCNLIGSSLLTQYFSDQPYISTTLRVSMRKNEENEKLWSDRNLEKYFLIPISEDLFRKFYFQSTAFLFFSSF